jgi:hypothetical protein
VTLFDGPFRRDGTDEAFEILRRADHVCLAPGRERLADADFLATGSDEYSGAWVPGSSKYVYLTNKNGEEKLRIHSRNENWDRLIVGNHGFDGTIVKSAPAASPETP